MSFIGQKFELGIGLKGDFFLTVVDNKENLKKIIINNQKELEYSAIIEDMLNVEGDLYYKFLVYKYEKFIGTSYVDKRHLKKLGLKKVGNA